MWGTPYLLIKETTASFNPAALVFVRTAIGSLTLLPIAIRSDAIRPVLRRWRVVACYTAAELAVPWFFLASAERRLPSSTSALIIAAVPVISAVLARSTGARERLGATRTAGLVVGLSGVAVLVGFNARRHDLIGLTELIACALGYAIGPWIFHERLSDLPPTGVVTVSLVFCCLAWAPLGIAQLPTTMPGPRVLLSLAGLAFGCTAAAFLVFFALIAEAGPARALVVTFVNPMVAVVLGVTVLGEAFTVTTAVGCVLILAGSVLATRMSGARAGSGAEAGAGSGAGAEARA